MMRKNSVRALLCVTLLMSSFSFSAMADDDSMQDLMSSMQRRRTTGAYITLAVGASILIVPQMSTSSSSSGSSTETSDRTSRLFFSLAGATVLLGGIKSLLVPSEPERILQRMEELKKDGKLTPFAEDQLLVQLVAAARADRYWGAGMSMVGGAVSIVSGTTVSDKNLKTFAVTLGALGVFGGVMQLIKPAKIERVVANKVAWEFAPTVLAEERRAVPGMGLGVSF